MRLENDMPNVHKTKRVNFEANLPQIQVLAIGDSHVLLGINPERFSLKGFNMGSDVLDLYEEQSLLAKYADRMPKLKLVLLNLSYFSLAFKHEYATNHWIMCQFAREYAIPLENLTLLPQYNYCSNLLKQDENPFTNIVDWVRYGKHFDANAPTPGYNGWLKNEKVLQPDLTKAISRVTAHENWMHPADIPTNLRRLIEINRLLKARKVRLVLFTTPHSPFYNENVTPAKYAQMQQDIASLTQQYDISYYNYFRDRRFSDADFEDMDHLNVQGAEKLSQIINEEIIQPVLVKRK